MCIQPFHPTYHSYILLVHSAKSEPYPLHIHAVCLQVRYLFTTLIREQKVRAECVGSPWIEAFRMYVILSCTVSYSSIHQR